jgi:tetratricopeptide (TPR) repeat protein
VLINAGVVKWQFQIAEVYAARALVLNPHNKFAIDLLGFIYYSLKNYKKSFVYTEKGLKLNRKNSYAWKVRGLSLEKMGNPKEGARSLKKAIILTKHDCTDIYINLAVILDRMKKTKKAFTILKQGRKSFPQSREKSDALYAALQRKLGKKTEKAGEKEDFVPVDTLS